LAQGLVVNRVIIAIEWRVRCSRSTQVLPHFIPYALVPADVRPKQCAAPQFLSLALATVVVRRWRSLFHRQGSDVLQAGAEGLHPVTCQAP